MRWLVGLLLAALLALVPAPATAAPGRHRSVTPCSRGLVALTFDDGPSTTVTTKLVRLLTRLDVPATFFMVGTRVAAAPDTARLVERAGFAIGNHTWLHTDLTTQSDPEIRTALRSTHRALVAAGVHPTRLARPPYGAVNDRVRGVLAHLGLVPVLWTIDSRDWTGLSPAEIRDRVLAGVHRHRTNVVLQHDGVTNSPATLKALPDEIATLRERGFCFASLDAAGAPTPPVPIATVTADGHRVTEGDRVHLTVRLDRPTSRPTTARVVSGGSQEYPSGHPWSARTVRFGVGDRVAHLSLPTRQDDLDEATEQVTFTVLDGHSTDGADGAHRPVRPVRIVDDDAEPVASAAGSDVAASPLVDTPAQVVVRLDHVSGRDVQVRVRAGQTTSWVSVPIGQRSAAFAVTVPPEGPGQSVREIPVRILRTVHAGRGDTSPITVRPPDQTHDEAARSALAGLTWPVVTVPRIF